MTEDQEQPCLHCELMLTIEDYYKEHGEQTPNGKFQLDLAEALYHVATCVADLVVSVDEEHRASARKQFFTALAVAMYDEDDEAEATLQ